MGNREDLAVYRREYERAQQAVKDWGELMEVTREKIEAEGAPVTSTDLTTRDKKPTKKD